jgi:hypothetical protein
VATMAPPASSTTQASRASSTPGADQSASTSSSVKSGRPMSAMSRARTTASTASASASRGGLIAWSRGRVAGIRAPTLPGPDGEVGRMRAPHRLPGCGNCVRIIASQAASGSTACCAISARADGVTV